MTQTPARVAAQGRGLVHRVASTPTIGSHRGVRIMMVSGCGLPAAASCSKVNPCLKDQLYVEDIVPTEWSD